MAARRRPSAQPIIVSVTPPPDPAFGSYEARRAARATIARVARPFTPATRETLRARAREDGFAYLPRVLDPGVLAPLRARVDHELAERGWLVDGRSDPALRLGLRARRGYPQPDARVGDRSWRRAASQRVHPIHGHSEVFRSALGHFVGAGRGYCGINGGDDAGPQCRSAQVWVAEHREGREAQAQARMDRRPHHQRAASPRHLLVSALASSLYSPSCPGLGPASPRTWMAGTSPAMTQVEAV